MHVKSGLLFLSVAMLGVTPNPGRAAEDATLICSESITAEMTEATFRLRMVACMQTIAGFARKKVPVVIPTTEPNSEGICRAMDYHRSQLFKTGIVCFDD